MISPQFLKEPNYVCRIQKNYGFRLFFRETTNLPKILKNLLEKNVIGPKKVFKFTPDWPQDEVGQFHKDWRNNLNTLQ